MVEWNLLVFAQLAFFGLGAWYFFKAVRKKTGEGLRCEDNIIEMDKLMLMKRVKSGCTGVGNIVSRMGQIHRDVIQIFFFGD